MKSYVVTSPTSPKLKEGYLKAIKDAQAGKEFVLPADVERSRQAHTAYMERLKKNGKLVCGGPFADFTEALLVFDAESEDEVNAIMQEDPHFKNGYVTGWKVREWHHRF